MRLSALPPLRDSAEYRAERLEVERQRLERRKVWAARRFEPEALEHLERQLARLRAEEAASIAPRGRKRRAARSAREMPGHYRAAPWRMRP